MCSALDHPPFIQHNDLIEPEKGEDAMGDNSGCFMLQIGIQVAYYLLLCAGVHGGKAVVEHHDIRVAEQAAGNGYTLFLSAAERYAPLPYQGIETFGEGQDVF